MSNHARTDKADFDVSVTECRESIRAIISSKTTSGAHPAEPLKRDAAMKISNVYEIARLLLTSELPVEDRTHVLEESLLLLHEYDVANDSASSLDTLLSALNAAGPIYSDLTNSEHIDERIAALRSIQRQRNTTLDFAVLLANHYYCSIKRDDIRSEKRAEMLNRFYTKAFEALKRHHLL